MDSVNLLPAADDDLVTIMVTINNLITTDALVITDGLTHTDDLATTETLSSMPSLADILHNQPENIESHPADRDQSNYLMHRD